MKVRFIGGPLDDTEHNMPEPLPAYWQAPWPPAAPVFTADPYPVPAGLPNIALYQLETWETINGRELRYVCLDRNPPGYVAQVQRNPAGDKLWADLVIAHTVARLTGEDTRAAIAEVLDERFPPDGDS